MNEDTSNFFKMNYNLAPVIGKVAVDMGTKFYKYEVKVGGARSEYSERPLWGSGGLPSTFYGGGARPPAPLFEPLAVGIEFPQDSHMGVNGNSF